MRLPALLLVLAAAIAVSAVLWWASGGRLVVFVLPLMLAGPLAWRKRRG